jgi:hypothetical protein
MRRARGLTFLLVVVPIAVGATALAATPEAAPPESREQVARALRALNPVLATSARKLDTTKAGTLEHALASFAPARYHPVEEGALPPVKSALTCPPEMAAVASRFCIDRWEASLDEKGADGALHPYTPSHALEAGHVYIARSAPGVIPQAYVSASQAIVACKAAGKRLCQAVEWRAACGGSAANAFPYGPARVAGTCHDTGATPMLVFHADTMKRGWGNLELNDPRLNELPNTVAKTGAFPSCVNDYGVFDMVGNLHEWAADPNGTFQGGYWLDTAQHGDGCAYRTIAHPADYHDYSTGFRCCADSLSSPAPSP